VRFAEDRRCCMIQFSLLLLAFQGCGELIDKHNQKT
jgi:hypothetical protein